MSKTNEPEETNTSENFENTYLPKPVLVQKQEKILRRSLISLLIYAFVFYMFFDQNVVYIASILLVIIIHEMGHFFAMQFFRYSNVKIFIIPLLGAFTSGKKQQVSQSQLSVIILAGPIPGIIIGSVLLWLNRFDHNETMTTLSYSFLFINILNLLPFFPLDGGRLVETLFFRNNYTVRLVFGIISIVALAIIFLFSSSFILLIIPVMIGLDIKNERRHEKIREYLKQEKINYYTDYANLPDKAYWLIRDCILFTFPGKYPGIQAGTHDYSPFEPIILQHVSSVLKVNLKFDLKVISLVLLVLLYIAAFVIPLFLYLKFRIPL